MEEAHIYKVLSRRPRLAELDGEEGGRAAAPRRSATDHFDGAAVEPAAVAPLAAAAPPATVAAGDLVGVDLEPPPKPVFRRLFSIVVDVLLPIFDLLLYVFDIASDLWVAVKYFYRNDHLEAALILAFALGPLAVVSAFSCYFYVKDYCDQRAAALRRGEKPPSKTAVALRVALCVCQLTVVMRLLEAIWFSFQYRVVFSSGRASRSRPPQSPPKPAARAQPPAPTEPSPPPSPHPLVPPSPVDTPDLALRRNRSYARTTTARAYKRLFRYSQLDLLFLKLIESFLESAPQLIIQLSKIFVDLQYSHAPTRLDAVQVGSLVLSAVSLAWAPVSYYRFLRQNDKPTAQRVSVPVALGVLFPWRLLMIAGRMLAVGWLISCYALAPIVIAFLGAHWVFSLAVLLGTEFWMRRHTRDYRAFCSSRLLPQVLFLAIMAYVHLFVYVNVYEGATWWRFTIHYVLVYIEDVFIAALCYNHKVAVVPVVSAYAKQLPFALLLIVVCSFWLGLLFLSVYYLYLHPKHKNVALVKWFRRYYGNDVAQTTPPERPAGVRTRQRSCAEQVAAANDPLLNPTPPKPRDVAPLTSPATTAL